MKVPLPDDLLEALKELDDCQGCIDDCQYNEGERTLMNKLKAVGLVELSWRITKAGRDCLKDA